MASTNRPEKTVCVGAIQVPIFANEIEGRKGSFTIHKATVSKRYKDKEGEWKSSNSFTADEIPAVIRALEKAYDLMKGVKVRENGEESQNQDEDSDVF